MDKLVHGIAADGTIRVISAVTTETVAEGISRHPTSPTAGAALGRTMTGAAMMAATLKDFDRLTAKIECTGAVGGITAEATPDGSVRGYLKNPLADTPSKDNGKFDVSGIIGGGTFFIIRESGFEIGLHQKPYVGSVPIVSGEIAEDFAYYLTKSEQIPSAVLLGVLLQNSEPYVTAAGGVMVQVMPGANDFIVTMIEDTVRRVPHVTSLIKAGATPAEMLKQALGEVDFEILGERDVNFKCNCSLEKAKTMIASLGKDEIESMLAEGNGAVMNCGFCNASYELNNADLEELLSSV
jgi:molecular chaperone Hsp33